MTTEELMALSDTCVMGTYTRFPIVLVRGDGSKVWDSEGKEYIDCVAGIAVCSLGHSHRGVVEAIKQQADRLTHVSNLYYIEPQILFATLLVEHSFADRAFFCNSGAEANEAAIKLARKYAHDATDGSRYEIITMENSFHGRTLTTVAATGQKRFQAGFDPLPGGFRYVPFDDIGALEDAITDQTCAVMVEPIQGEGGIKIPGSGYLKEVRKICDDRNLLLIFDEVQVGMGRTGRLFAYEETGVTPDIMTLAKAIGNGFPMGAMLATEGVAAAFTPGSHASTFGGNPLAMAAGMAVMEAMLHDGILEQCRETGAYFVRRLNELKERHAIIKEVRGRGLIIGMELSRDGGDLVRAAMERGVLINCTCGNILRFVPPLTISRGDVDRVIDVIDEVVGQC